MGKKYNDGIGGPNDPYINYDEERMKYYADNLDINIDFSEYIAENLDETLKYQEYLAEKLNSSLGISKEYFMPIRNNDFSHVSETDEHRLLHNKLNELGKSVEDLKSFWELLEIAKVTLDEKYVSLIDKFYPDKEIDIDDYQTDNIKNDLEYIETINNNLKQENMIEIDPTNLKQASAYAKHYSYKVRTAKHTSKKTTGMNFQLSMENTLKSKIFKSLSNRFSHRSQPSSYDTITFYFKPKMKVILEGEQNYVLKPFEFTFSTEELIEVLHLFQKTKKKDNIFVLNVLDTDDAVKAFTDFLNSETNFSENGKNNMVRSFIKHLKPEHEAKSFLENSEYEVFDVDPGIAEEIIEDYDDEELLGNLRDYLQ